MKKRIDQILVDNGLVESKTKAQALVMAGQVFADGHRIDKSGTKLESETNVCVKELFPYVSRGALKLEKAFIEFNLDFKDKTVCDIGSSTGGFTDFALQNGATKVFAVDVGTGQLAQKIREDERVVVMEKTDFRDVRYCPLSSSSSEAKDPDFSAVPQNDKKYISDPIDIFVCDVSFISLKKIIPKIKELIVTQQSTQVVIPAKAGIQKVDAESLDSRLRGNDEGVGIDIILLIKPQFEAGVKEVSKGKGVIKDEQLRHEITEDIKNFARDSGFSVSGLVSSPITGAKGNIEFLLYLKLP